MMVEQLAATCANATNFLQPHSRLALGTARSQTDFVDAETSDFKKAYSLQPSYFLEVKRRTVRAS